MFTSNYECMYGRAICKVYIVCVQISAYDYLELVLQTPLPSSCFLLVLIYNKEGPHAPPLYK